MGQRCWGLRCWVGLALLEMVAGWVCQCQEQWGQSRLALAGNWVLCLEEVSPVSSVDLTIFRMYLVRLEVNLSWDLSSESWWVSF